MDYDVAFRLENAELRGGISNFTVPVPSIPALILFYIK